MIRLMTRVLCYTWDMSHLKIWIFLFNIQFTFVYLSVLPRPTNENSSFEFVTLTK